MIRKLILTACFVMGLSATAGAQDHPATGTTLPKLALKTNLLYDAWTFTPNLGLEIGLGRKTTLDISGGYNPWKLDGSWSDNKKLVHWYVQPEFRFWTCERFNGHFFGIHALGGMYNVSEHKVPNLFGSGNLFDKDSRYEGYAIGAGVSYGYHFILSSRISLELTAGLGYLYFDYDQYGCKKCDRQVQSKTKHYFGPTKLGVSFIVMIR